MWVVCLFAGLGGLVLSYSLLKFNGTPLFSISIKPGLVVKQGKPPGSRGRTDSGLPARAPRQEPVCCPPEQPPSCLVLARLRLLLQRAVLPPVKMCLEK